ncbi:SIS domain-containing protein [Aquimixticola soesokkakensis]|uniref:SIS domain-containing protein n=1 Tax=Aquimixticola soesokkakensis TaxID=1519096 RepID=UPI0011786A32|nr:SIS domain-containing protein [Aquimixticola soesokkakensis]
MSDLARASAPSDWLGETAREIAALPLGLESAAPLGRALDGLLARFPDLMSCGTAMAVDGAAALRADVEAMAQALGAHEAALVAISSAGNTDVDPLIERVRDVLWQVEREMLGAIARITDLLGDLRAPAAFAVAFGAEHVITAIDRLEVRGRDSAGIHLQLSVPALASKSLLAALGAEADFAARLGDLSAGHLAISLAGEADARIVLGFTYKTANLIGRLGDNGAALRAAIKGDALLWKAAAVATQLDVLSHTRWASSGVISVANCHPHNASVTSDRQGDAAAGQWVSALNGDVDNHHELGDVILTAHQRAVASDITTDAKIIPIACRFADTAARGTSFDTFRSAIRRLDGSMAIAALYATHPGEVMIAQKGSGQGMHLARVADGWMFASEVYGLASLTRRSFDIARSLAGGVAVRVQAGAEGFDLVSVADGAPVAAKDADIQIYARDIFRGDYATFFEKEINEGPASVAKTLRGRYRRVERRVSFDGLANDIWAQLREFARGTVSRVYVIGQGTAGVAAEGIAHLVEHALASGPYRALPVHALRSSELSAEIDRFDMKNALVIAVSQSGTTTDTNRAVDLAIERGAFVHCIVNRRGSDLVRKANSVFYTSDGRDIEMSVASTKAFYAQLVAGKLTSLFLANALGTMSSAEIEREIADLEDLPEKVSQVLGNEAQIIEAAHEFAPKSRYWAVVGSGVNHIAAMEIRIKLSELCYKSIPVDFTEDKKHIDLSTEPLTLVIANDIQPELLGDLVKEVAVFRAHNGKPLVFAAQGPEAEAFEAYAERVVALPKTGSSLGFILAAVAGHLFGLHAARAIDEGAQKLRLVLNALGACEAGEAGALETALGGLDAIMQEVAASHFDSGLRAADIGQLALWRARLAADAAPDQVTRALRDIRHVFEETSRPIDTIRHQAKTVTVGTSRPDDVLAPVVREAFGALKLAETQLSTRDRKALASVSRLIESVSAADHLCVERSQQITRVRYARGDTRALGVSYATLREPVGTLGLALDQTRLTLGRAAGEALVLAVPIYAEDQSTVAGVLQLTVALHMAAPRAQKVAAIKALGHFGPLLRVWENWFDVDAETMLIHQIGQADPETVLFHPSLLEEQAEQVAKASRAG